LGLNRHVSFHGHANDEEKRRAFIESDVCVVPSFSENFGMVVAESLAHGVPVIVGRGAPWSQVESHNCGLWVDNSDESLAKAITSMRSLPLEDMGQRGRSWMQDSFAWPAIAREMAGLYQDLSSRVRKNDA